jgi:predicted transcriptional regulator
VTRPAQLERQVLDVLWRGGRWSVRDVLGALQADLAYTTVATVLDRLHTKGQVVRSMHERSWSYASARSREAAMGDQIGKLLRGSQAAGEPLLTAFLDEVEQIDPEALERLEGLIRKRRKGRGP